MVAENNGYLAISPSFSYGNTDLQKKKKRRYSQQLDSEKVDPKVNYWQKVGRDEQRLGSTA